MKPLVTAMILTLSSGGASAVEIYGDFANLDNSPESDTAFGVEYGLSPPSPADFEVSLYRFPSHTDSARIRASSRFNQPALGSSRPEQITL